MAVTPLRRLFPTLPLLMQMGRFAPSVLFRTFLRTTSYKFCPSRIWFPQGECRLVTNRRGSPVQHASLIFHCFDFQPSIAAFYRRLKSGKARQAA
ncbi:MAG: hypothetical protein ABSG50_03165 [Opitutaceae bacterium]|jgi:hypothetical protein